jgi:phosphoribosyl 1,2-cyclic phosphate phosphodiesterase
MKITVLGCGGSMGTPSSGGFWGVCDPNEPRNERTRASLMVQSKKTTLLIDGSYDLRHQLNRHKAHDITAMLLSHAHSDHVNGLDDLRSIAYSKSALLDVYGNAETLKEVDRRWPYMFGEMDKIYVPFLKAHTINSYDKFTIGDIDIECFEQDHLTCKSLGFRFGDFAYCVDLVNLNERSLAALKGVETWIVDGGAYQRETVTTHANLKRVFEWVDILKPKMTYLTVLTTHMDYKTLCDELPSHIRPAYDGMEIGMGTNLR